MKNMLAKSVRFCVLAGILVFSTASAWAVCTPGPGPIGAGTANFRLREAMDVDNDCKADYSIFRPSNNVWYIAKSTGGFAVTQWGLAAEDYPTPGDFDGEIGRASCRERV